MTLSRIGTGALLCAALFLAACSGSGTGNNSSSQPIAQAATCDSAGSMNNSACGTLLVGFTDADGDFLSYTVDVTQLTLETANGRTVEVLPTRTRVNFADYIDLTELVTATAIPPATYVAGSISLDYSDAEIIVEDGENSKTAVVTDADGKPLQEVDLRILLSNRDQLTISRGRAALLQLDFDLDASHTVDIEATPALAMADHFILAEVHPVAEKDFRVRGPLLQVNEVEMHYEVVLRPFFDRHGDFGLFTVNIADDTEFEVDGVVYVGSDGLRALKAAGRGTPTIAHGTLAVDERSYSARRVLAGSSVPGSDLDAVAGNIIQRHGNFLTVRGATIIPRDSASDRRAHFHDDVIVEVGPATRVYKDGWHDNFVHIDALSIGQRVTIRGQQTLATHEAAAPQVLFDATNGAVRMHVTHLAGIVNTVMPGQIDIDLQAIDRRRAAVFNFAGTGPAPAQEADPGNYEIDTGNLTLADIVAGQSLVAFGFPTPFGMAPPDFTARTVVDYSDANSVLGIAWGQDGTIAPFASIGTDGIVLALDNGEIGVRHHIKQGPALLDLLRQASNTTVVPRSNGRTLFSIKTAASLRLYSAFDDFVTDLSNSLNGATTARAFYARGRFDAASNTFTATKIGVTLMDPPL